MLKGDLSATPLSDVLAALADQALTGCLHIDDEAGDEALVYFKNGRVYAAYVPGRRPQLGARLVSSGALAPEALAEALEAQETELQGWRLGELLVHLGYVEKPIVEAFVIEQLREAAYDLSRWQSGRYRFRKNEKTRAEVGSDAAVHDLLAEAARRRNEWARLGGVLHGPAAVPVLSAGGLATAEMTLDQDQWALLCKVDGDRTIAQLARDCGFTTFEAGQIVYALVDAGLLQVDVEEPEAEVDEELAPVGAALASAFAAPQPVEVPEEFDFVRDSELSRLLGTPEEPALEPVAAALPVAAEPVAAEPEPFAAYPADDPFGDSLARVSHALNALLGDPLPAVERPEPVRETVPEEPESVRLETERIQRMRAAAAAELAEAHAMAEAARQARLSEEGKRATAEAAVARLTQEQADREEAARLAAQRAAAERAAAEEAARLDAERAAAEETARLEAARLEAERLEAERVAAERLAAEEAARLEAARLETERLEAERVAAERVAAEEAARLEAARLEAERLEAERVAAEENARAEAERRVAERRAEERREAERMAAEEAAEAERRAEERRQAERVAAEAAAAAEAERAAAEAAEAERAAAEAAAQEAARQEIERLAAEETARAEAERVAAEEAARLAAEDAARAEAERVAAEEAARLDAERAAAEEAARAEAERVAAEEAERAEAERRAAAELARLEFERIASEEAARAEAEEARLAAERQAAADAKLLADRYADDALSALTAPVAPAASANAFEVASMLRDLNDTPVAAPAAPAEPEPVPAEPEPAYANGHHAAPSDTAALLRELSSLGIEDDPNGQQVHTPSAPRHAAAQQKDQPKKRKGLFGRS